MLKAIRTTPVLFLLLGHFSCCTVVGQTLNLTEHLGTNSWKRFRPGWLLTVNDQCLYEFTFQFEHDDELPMGGDGFTRECSFNGGTPFKYDDGISWLDARMHWEEFPSYVWATMGFNHLSVDWFACGTYPGGYATPHYQFSFYRVTPEFRANTMTCDVASDQIIPGDKGCSGVQQADNMKGKNFFILPGSVLPISDPDRTRVVNMPTTFGFPDGGAAVEHQGLRLNDQTLVPPFPDKWNDIQLFMSTYGGDLAMWQPRIPFRMLNGTYDQFHSNAKRYHQTTVATLPDTFAFDYDASDGVIRFHMIGKSQLCKSDFERARDFANGAPVFPNYNDEQFEKDFRENGWGDEINRDTSGTSGSKQYHDGSSMMMICLSTIGMILFNDILL